MSNEISKPTAEAGWPNKLKIKAGIAIGILALSTAATTTESQSAQAASKAPGIERVGFSTNDLFNQNLAEAETVAAKIQAMGGTAVRIFYTLNKNTAWQNYAQETCNAFQAAYDHQLQPIVTFRGYDESGPGYVPQSPTEIKQLGTTAASIIWTVASNKDSQHPGGCVPGQKNFIFEGINEINNGYPFNRNLGVNTPAQALMIDSKLSQALKKEAARPEIQANVTFGEALAVGNHDVVGFLNSQAQFEIDLKLNNPYDFIDVHPYPKNPTDDPSITMANLYPTLSKLINNSFHGAKLVWGEIGVNTTDPPTAEAANYTPPVSHILGVSEATQVKYITNVLKTAAAEGTPWVTLFDVQDDGNGSMPSSGEYYVSGTPKSSLGPIAYRLRQYQQK